MKHAVWLLVLILSTTSPAFAGPYEDAVQKGNAAVQTKDYKAAAEAYENAIKANPGSAKAHLLLGLTYANTGDFDKAIQHTLAAIQLDPSYAGYHNLGLIYANKGEYEKALDAYDHALKISPQSSADWYQLGLVYVSHGEFAKGIEAYQKSIQNNPQFTSAYLGLGSAYYWSGNTSAALAQVEALKKIKKKIEAEQLDKWIKDKEIKKAARPKPAA